MISTRIPTRYEGGRAREQQFQLTNKIYSLEMNELEELSERLKLLRTCHGSRCEQLSRPDWKEFIDDGDSRPL